MALTLDGSTGYLSWSGNIVSSRPFTLFGWIRPASTSVVAMPIGISEVSADAYASALQINSSIYASDRSPGNSTSAEISGAIDTANWQPVMAVFKATGRTIYYAANTPVTDATANSPTLADIDSFSIGGIDYNGGGLAFPFPGDVAEVAVWGAELDATDFATLSGDVHPETVQSGSLIEHWSLLTLGSYAGSVSRTLTAHGTITQTADHPITRSAGATTYTLEGPSAGTVGVASSNFTVTPDAAVSADVVVTPSDGGDGGTFSPTSVTFASGTSTAQTFTYTPASAGVKTISTTNNGGLTDPASVSFTASAAATFQAAWAANSTITISSGARGA